MTPENNGVIKIEDIIEINKLILQYRDALTTGNINNNGGFEVKSEILGNSNATPINLMYKGNKVLYVLQQGGNVCGFGSQNNGDKINYFLINKEDSQEDDDKAARNYIRNKAEAEDGDCIAYYCAELNLKQYNKLDSRNNISKFSTINKNLLCLFNELIRTDGSLGIMDKFRQKELVDTFLLVCSECAKNSLLHQQLISNLLYHYEAEQYVISKGEKYEEPEFSNGFLKAFMTASENCKNGVIKYLNGDDSTELDEIIKSFQLEDELERATGYDESFPKELLDRLMKNGDQIQIRRLERSERRYLTKKGIRYENGSITSTKKLRYLLLIKSQYYKDCQTLLDLTDKNMNDKMDSSFVSRVIRYLNKKDARIVNLIKLKKDSLISLILNVDSNLKDDSKAQMIKALINNQIFSDFFQTMKQQWSGCNIQTTYKEMSMISNLLVLATKEKDKNALNNFIKNKVDEMLCFIKTLQGNKQYDFERKLDWAKQAVGLVNDPKIKVILDNIITIAQDAVDSTTQRPTIQD